MEEATIARLCAVRDYLSECQEANALSDAEDKLNRSEEAKRLSSLIRQQEGKLEFSLNHFGEGSEQSKAELHALYLYKKEIDELPESREYMKAYSAYRKLLDRVNDALFEVDLPAASCGRRHG